MIEITDLVVRKDRQVICRVPYLAVSRGARLAVVGENGSGKTTLLRVLAGLERELSGTMNVDSVVKKRVYVHQSPYLFQGTVASNAAYGIKHLTRQRIRSQVEKWLTHFGIEHLANKNVKTLSGGERRRAALARSFATDPHLLLLDEPLAELDDENALRTMHAIKSIPDTTVVLTSPTHREIFAEWDLLRIERPSPFLALESH